MNAGPLRDRITVQQQSTVQDGFGQALESWQDVLTRWAQVTSATGKEVYAASGFAAQTSHTALIRWTNGLADTITTAMRVLHRGRAYEIVGVSDVDGTRQTLTLALLQIGSAKLSA